MTVKKESTISGTITVKAGDSKTLTITGLSKFTEYAVNAETFEFSYSTATKNESERINMTFTGFVNTCVQFVPKILPSTEKPPTTYNIYLQGKAENGSICETGLCDVSNIYCALLKNNKYFHRFALGPNIDSIQTTNEKNECASNTLYLTRQAREENVTLVSRKREDYIELVSGKKVLLDDIAMDEGNVTKTYVTYNYTNRSLNPCNEIKTCPASLLLGTFTYEKNTS